MIPPDVGASPVRVVCAADAGYVAPLAVMVQSILHNLGTAYRLDLTIIDAGLGATNRARLASHWRGHNVTARCIQPHPQLRRRLSSIPVPAGIPHVNHTSLLRLLVERFLPATVGRILYLDCDLVVNTCLSGLWETPMDGASLLAVQDYFVQDFRHADVARIRPPGVPPATPYFNAGVMCIDLQAWRAASVGSRCLRFLRGHGRRARYLDQDALNVVLVDRWKAVDFRWNQQRRVHVADADGLPFDAAEMQRVLAGPFISHFTTADKPWHPGCRHGRAPDYHRYLAMTPWRTGHGVVGDA